MNTEVGNVAPTPKKIVLPAVATIAFLLVGAGFFVVSSNIANLQAQLAEKATKESIPENLLGRIGTLEEFKKSSEEKENASEIGADNLKPTFATALTKSFETLDESIVATQTETEKMAFILQEVFNKNFTEEERTKIIEAFLTKQKLKEKEESATPREKIDWLGAAEKKEETTLLETATPKENEKMKEGEKQEEEKPTESSPSPSPTQTPKDNQS